jgi:poly(A) polymerase
MKKNAREKVKILQSQLKRIFPKTFSETIAGIHHDFGGQVFLTGGTVRDLIIQRPPADIDITVDRHAGKWAARFSKLTGGTFIPLGREEDAARVVTRKTTVDFSSFRLGAQTIEQELKKRDISINSMAVSILDFCANPSASISSCLEIIDPVGGLRDIDNKCIRITSPRSFSEDPLRLLRIFRFSAILNFFIDPESLADVSRQKQLLSQVSSERITHECNLIMASERAYETFRLMARHGLLFQIIPELEAGQGMQQPESHHLDVFEHNLEALCWIEKIIKNPAAFYPGSAPFFNEYLDSANKTVQLKWAALFHDLGKPSTYGINEDKDNRIIFYNHDNAGAELVKKISSRLKWSRDASIRIATLVAHHMRPFHLCNVQRESELSTKACLRIIKAVKDELPGLFLLSMADSLAGQGTGRPNRIEEELHQLFNRVNHVQKSHVMPVQSRPPLITGRDLISKLGLTPGPIFKKILLMLEEAHMENTISTREEALALAADYAKNSAKN